MQLEYNPDLVLTQEHTEAEIQNFTGSFCGFVLLKEQRYDLYALGKRLQQMWGIALMPSAADAVADDLMLDVPGAMVTISYMAEPVPEGEAEAAAVHARWADAAEIAKEHKAHLMIAVLPDCMSAIDAGVLYCRIISEALNDEKALAVYTSGTILEPVRFQQCTAQTSDSLPIDNLIFVGTYRRDGGNCGYTVGLDSFGKDELELLDSALSQEAAALVLKTCAAQILYGQNTPQWYHTFELDGAVWEGRRKDGVMVEGHSIQLQRKL